MLLNGEKSSSWTTLKNTKEPIIVFGTGNGADKVFEEFSRRGISVSGVAASDGFVRSRSFHGFKVEPVSYYESIYESFTVAVVFGSSRPEVIENIKAIGERHNVLVPCVPVVGNTVFDEEFLRLHEKALEEARECFSDELSRRVFDDYTAFEFTGRLSYLFDAESDEKEAFENCLQLSENETYVDIGAYRGDTVEGFLKYTGGSYDEIIAAEPDTKSFNKLVLNCGELKNFRAENAAVTGFDGTVLFSQSAGRQSAVGSGKPIVAVSLETLCKNSAPTYVKIDAEGEETDIIEGAKDFLAKTKPKMNIAVYHKNEDVFKIPLLLKEICPEYKIYLRHFPYIPAWDTLVFCKV